MKVIAGSHQKQAGTYIGQQQYRKMLEADYHFLKWQWHNFILHG